MPNEKHKMKPTPEALDSHDEDAVPSPRSVGGMTDHPVTLRLPDALLERVEELVPHIAADLEFASMGRVSRSQVLRIAVFQGLNVLRQRYSLAQGHPVDRE